MWVLMLQPPAREDVSCREQFGDDGLVGVALLALVVDDALALETVGFLRVEAVGVNGIGNARLDLA